MRGYRLTYLLLLPLMAGLAWIGWQGWWYRQALRTPPVVGTLMHPERPDTMQRQLPRLLPTAFAVDSFRQPPAYCRPWLRWYWAGSGPDDVDIIETVQRARDQGFGGLEIYPSGRGLARSVAADPRADWQGAFSWRFFQQLALAQQAARARGLGIDLHMGLGQPVGSPQTPATASLVNLAFGEAQVLGGKWIDMPLPAPRIPGSYYLEARQARQAGLVPQPFLAEAAQPLAVFAARRRTADRSWLALDLQDQVVLDPDSMLQLGLCPPEDGRLQWHAPPGYWTIIVIYQMPAGLRPPQPAGSQAGFAIDYLDSTQLTAYHSVLLGSDTSQLTGLRAISHDDLRWALEQPFNVGMLEYFQAVRGYDPTPWLPVLLQPGAAHAGLARHGWARSPEYRLDSLDERVRYDYALTLSDWLIQHYLPPVQRWSAARGLRFRSQLYGMDLDLIRAAAASDLPETSQDYAGGSGLFTKLAVAGAWWAGRPLVSAEAWGFEGRRGSLTPQKAKLAADKLLTSGVNHLILLGEVPDLPGQPAPGWPVGPDLLSRLDPRGPFGGALPELTRYLARCQYLLRQGQPAVDIWLYYPFLGFPPAWGDSTAPGEFLAGGRLPEVDADEAYTPAGGDLPLPRESDPRVAWLAQVWPLIQALEARGLTWTWVNDDILQAATWNGDQLQSRALPGELILLPELPYMSWESAWQVQQLSAAGAPVVVYGQAPSRQPGWAAHAVRDVAVAQIMDALASPIRPQTPAEMVNWLLSLPDHRPLAYLEPMPSLAQLRRTWPGGGQMLFFANQQNQDRPLGLRFTRDFGHAYWLDPWTGSLTALGPVQATTPLRQWLPAYGSGFLLLTDQALLPVEDTEPPDLVRRALPEHHRVAIRQLRHWSVVVAGTDVAGGLFSRGDTSLFDWREEAALRYCGSEANYSHSFQISDTLPGHRYLLDLGEVAAVAEVRVNTVWAGACWLAPYRLDITPYLNPGLNLVEVWVRPPPRNRWVGYSRQGVAGYEAYADRPLLPGGLLGPVSLWEIKPD